METDWTPYWNTNIWKSNEMKMTTILCGTRNSKLIRQCQTRNTWATCTNTMWLQEFKIENKNARGQWTRGPPVRQKRQQFMNLVTLNCYVHVAKNMQRPKASATKMNSPSRSRVWFCQLQSAANATTMKNNSILIHFNCGKTQLENIYKLF